MKKILIIEDDALLADIYRDNFENEGFMPEVASDGDIAIQRLKSNPPDVVISDLMLPSVNGVEVLKFIRSQESTRTLPVLVMSNAYASSLGQEATQAGATKCLAKNSCGPKRLVEEVRSLLEAANAPALAEVAVGAVAVAAPALAALPFSPPPVAPAIPAPSFVASPGRPAAPALAKPAPVPLPKMPTPTAPVTSTGSSPTPTTAGSPTAFAGSDGRDIRSEMTQKMPERLSELRQLLQSLGKTDDNTRPNCLMELYRRVHALAGGASFAGLTRIALLACALETLLKELQAKPKKLNPSSMRTIAQAIDVIAVLAARITSPPDNPIHSPLILVVDDEPISREMTCTALEQAHLRALTVEQPEVALKLSEENRFDLIFLDVQMPGLNGFEVCQKIHATGANAKTPVVFVTALTDFETRSRSTLSGGVDFIAKPILLIELAVKAMTHLLRAEKHVPG